MFEPTAKDPTDRITIQGPARRRDELEAALLPLGFSIVPPGDAGPPPPWREALPASSGAEPGAALRGMRAKLGLTQMELSRQSAIPQPHLSEMENGKRPIGKDTAKRLGRAMDVDYRVFL